MPDEAGAKTTLRPEVAFFLFALLLGARDIGAELMFSEQDAEARWCFAFLICATITLLSFFLILFRNGLPELIRKVRAPRVLYRVILVGVSAAVVYLVTFEWIGRMGAGLFNLFDYGLAPILTALFGILLFRNPVTRRLLPATLAYILGLLLLFWDYEMGGWAWLGITILSPIGTAISDATTKWLLGSEGGSLARSELLFVRFLPATVLIGTWILATGNEIHIHAAEVAIPLAVVCGFLPLWLLCTGLGSAALTKYAVWEFLIPAMVFFLTLPIHPEHRTVQAVAGASCIILAVVFHEIRWPAGLQTWLQRLAKPQAGAGPG